MSSPKAVERNHSAPSCSYRWSAGPQPLDRLVHPAVAVERALGLPDVEVDAEPLQRRLDPGSHPLRRPAAEDLGPVGSGGGSCRRDVVRHRRREVADVLAVIAVLGHRLAVPGREHGRTELADLGAEVVEVVLARHDLPAGLEDAAQEVADERAARVADVEWPGRVRRHELDVDLARDVGPEPAPVGRRREDAVRPLPRTPHPRPGG